MFTSLPIEYLNILSLKAALHQDAWTPLGQSW